MKELLRKYGKWTLGGLAIITACFPVPPPDMYAVLKLDCETNPSQPAVQEFEVATGLRFTLSEDTVTVTAPGTIEVDDKKAQHHGETVTDPIRDGSLDKTVDITAHALPDGNTSVRLVLVCQ